MKTIRDFNILFDSFIKDGKNGDVPWGYGRSRYNHTNKPQNDRDDNNFLQWSWETGGSQGGSCWGGESEPYTSSEQEPDETPLDAFLEKYFPDISFLHYKKVSGYVETHAHSQNEYYGNCTEYLIKHVSKQELLRALQNTGYVEK